jgi:uncharacterized FlaG/YvyC family protein
MSDLNVTVVPLKSLEIAKDAAVTHSKETNSAGHSKLDMLSTQEKLDKQSAQAKLTDLNYSIDHEDNALHLKIKSADGEVVREMIFDRIDPSLVDAKKLKGVFVDGNS